MLTQRRWLAFVAGFLGLTLAWTVTGVALAQAPEAGQSYVVQPGDTLSKIAEKLLGDGNRYPEIVASTQAKRTEDSSYANLLDPDVVVVGTKLWVTPAGAPALAPGPALAGANFGPGVIPLRAGDTPQGQIAFSFWNAAPNRCTYEINVIDVSSCLADSTACQQTRRIFALNNASEPALSPDGQRLAFRGWGDIPEKYNDETQDHPYFGCAAPTAPRQVGHATLDGTDYHRASQYYEDAHPDWSLDGQRLLYDTGRLGDGRTRLIAANAVTEAEEDLRLEGQQPSWAPDSDRFVFRGCDLSGNRCGIWLARAIPMHHWDAGQNLIAPVLVEPAAAHPDWSPVGEQIVYQSPVGGSWDLYVINVDGAGKRQLTDAPGIEGLPVWSPDGQWIAYLAKTEGQWGIWIISADGSRRQLLFGLNGGSFSPGPVPPYHNRDWIDEQLSWSR